MSFGTSDWAPLYFCQTWCTTRHIILTLWNLQIFMQQIDIQIWQSENSHKPTLQQITQSDHLPTLSWQTGFPKSVKKCQKVSKTAKKCQKMPILRIFRGSRAKKCRFCQYLPSPPPKSPKTAKKLPKTAKNNCKLLLINPTNSLNFIYATFRKAILTDADSVAQLVNSAYRGESSWAGWTTEAGLLDGLRVSISGVQRLIESVNVIIFLCFNDADLIISICIENVQDTAQIGMFVVKPTL